MNLSGPRTLSRLSAAVFIAQLAFGQAPAPRPAFEVTSVKPYKPGATPTLAAFGCTPESGKFAATRAAVAVSIRWAYGVGPYQTMNYGPVNQQYVLGMPAWAAGAEGVFDIEGKAAGPVTDAQCRLMLQSLLADRFKLALHREMRTLPVTALVVAKGGPKRALAKALDSDPDKRVMVNGTVAYASEKGWSMAQLTEYLLRFYNGQIIVDKTGLDGQYRFTLDFSVTPPAAGGPPNIAEEVSAALQDQLGLKIEDRKEPVEVVVIDHIEKPNEN